MRALVRNSGAAGKGGNTDDGRGGGEEGRERGKKAKHFLCNRLEGFPSPKGGKREEELQALGADSIGVRKFV